MATNPMQRQARNSFLLGMVLTLVISAAIIAFLFIQIKNLKEEINKKKAATVQVYTLSQDVKAGQIITSDMCMAQMVDAATVPAGATNDINSLLNTFSLCDKDGRDIYTDADGTLYMMINQKKVEVKEETNNNVTSYYIANGSNKEYIELSHKTIVAKVALKANTVITGSLISRGKLNTDDVRQMEYNVLSLPTDLIDGDYIDVRFMLPNGQDFIVVSKKEVTIPNIGGAY